MCSSRNGVGEGTLFHLRGSSTLLKDTRLSDGCHPHEAITFPRAIVSRLWLITKRVKDQSTIDHVVIVFNEGGTNSRSSHNTSPASLKIFSGVLAYTHTRFMYSEYFLLA